jgi:hypothetical protein
MALVDEKESVVGEVLVLDDLADAPDLSGRAVGAREDDTEAEVSLQLCLTSCHHGRS